MDTSTTFDAGPATATRETPARLPGWLPLAGTAYAVLGLLANLSIGSDFPDGTAGPARIARFYADHHSGVAHAGLLGALAAVLLGVFVATVAVSCRPALLAAVLIGVGGAAQVAHEEWSAATNLLLGDLGAGHGLSPQALQVWQSMSYDFGTTSAMLLLLIGFAVAGRTAPVVPAWLGWSALVLGLAQFLPGIWGFWAALLVGLWFAVAGVTLTVRRVGAR